MSGSQRRCGSKLIYTCSFGTCASGANTDLAGGPESWACLCYASATCPDYSWHAIPIKGPFVFDGVETELDIISLVNKGRHAVSQIQLPASRVAKLALYSKSEFSALNHCKEEGMKHILSFLLVVVGKPSKPPGEALTVLIKSSWSLHPLLHEHQRIHVIPSEGLKHSS